MKVTAIFWVVMGIFIAVVTTALLYIGKPELLLTLSPLIIFVGIAIHAKRGGI